MSLILLLIFLLLIFLLLNSDFKNDIMTKYVSKYKESSKLVI